MRIPKGRFTLGQVIPLALVLTAILLATLSRGGVRLRPFSFAFNMEGRGSSDAILNVGLFIPFGLALAWKGGVGRATLAGFVLSTLIEIAQTHIPGRDPALSDVVFNTIGTICGSTAAVTHDTWLKPNPRQAMLLSMCAVAFAALVMTAALLLLAPIAGTPSTLRKEISIPASPGDSRFVSTFAAVDMGAVAQPVVLARAGNDLLLRYPSRASELGLDQPEYWASDVFAESVPGIKVPLRVNRREARWDIEIGGKSKTLGPTVGRGWALLAYPETMGRRWGSLADVLWVAALCVPIGFVARRLTTFLFSSAAAAGALVLVPMVAGGIGSPVSLWLGAILGLLVGQISARCVGIWLP